MKPKLKINIERVETPTLSGFIGSLYKEDGETVIHEVWRPSKQWIIDELGPMAKEYARIYMEHHGIDTEELGDSEADVDSEERADP